MTFTAFQRVVLTADVPEERLPAATASEVLSVRGLARA
jgi:hypothetical protein